MAGLPPRQRRPDGPGGRPEQPGPDAGPGPRGWVPGRKPPRGRGPHGRAARGPGRHGPGALLAGFAAPSVLLLLAHRGEMHGYALRDELESSGLMSDVDFGNLYRALRRMEEAELVSSRWETGEPGPGRRVYALRPAGLRALGAAAGSLGKAREALARFFDLYEGVRGRAEDTKGSGAG